MKRSILILVIFVAAGIGAGLWWSSTSQHTDGFTSGEPVAWGLDGFGGANSDLAAASNPDPNVIRVFVAEWPVEFADSTWLTQTVAETPVSITITLRRSPAYLERIAHNPQINGRPVFGMYDTGGWVDVHLHDPRGNRMLLDGSAFPPAARS